MKFTKENMPIYSCPSGDVLYLNLYKFEGNNGPKIYIQANIHGPEIAGCLVVWELIKFFKKQKNINGSIILVPTANPIGLNTQIFSHQIGYFDLNSGKNWNRNYPILINKDSSFLKQFVKKMKHCQEKNITKEYQKLLKKILNKKEAGWNIEFPNQLANKLLSLSLGADIVFDLHTSWGKAPEYVYCYEKDLKKAIFLQVPFIFLLKEDQFEGVFDEALMVPWFNLQKAFGEGIKKLNVKKQVYTFELGQDCSLDEIAIKKNVNKLINFLAAAGVINKKISKKFSIHPFVSWQPNFIKYCAPEGGLLVWLKKPGEKVKKGEVFGKLISFKEGKTTSLVSPWDGFLLIQHNSQAVNKGQTIGKFMTNFWKYGGKDGK